MKIEVKTVEDSLKAVQAWSLNHPKSAKVANLLAEAQASLNAGENITIIKQKAQLAITEHQKRLAEQARRDAKKGNIVFAEMTPENIRKLIDEYESNTVSKMDGKLRPITETIWATLTDEERRTLTKYTQTYSYLNEPLRGIPYNGYRDKSEYTHDMPILTSALNKFKTAKDMVVRRGTSNFYIPELNKDLNMVSVGDEFTDGAFLSTAVHRTKGFHTSLNMVIVVPKGARGAFAEPFSHYTDSHRFNFNGKIWDGVSKESIQSEFEWIGQRGSRFKVLKVDGNTIVDVNFMGGCPGNLLGIKNIVKGMKMPKSYFDCHLFKNDECILIDYEDKDICDYGDMDLSQTGICPIIGELPEKHGRLIDADAFIEFLEKDYKYSQEKYIISDDAVKMLITKMYELLIDEIRQRPTVIESEE